MLESVYPVRWQQVVLCTLIIFLSGILSFAEVTSNNFPTYQHPKHSNQTCYKCPPGFYKVEDCQTTRHNTQHPRWPTCSSCSESQFSHGWNTDEQCWDHVPRNETLITSQVEIHPGEATRTAKCGCPGATIQDETENCVDAISMKDNLAMIKEIEEKSQIRTPCICTEVIPQPCHDRTEWLPSWAVGLIGMGLGLLIALGIFCIYSGCQKCRTRKVLSQRRYGDSGARPHVCIAVTATDNTPRSQRQETQRSMDIAAEIDDTNYPSGVHTWPRCSASKNRGTIVRQEQPDASARQHSHIHYGSLDSRQSLVHTINEGRQDPHHRSLPILFSCTPGRVPEDPRMPKCCRTYCGRGFKGPCCAADSTADIPSVKIGYCVLGEHNLKPTSVIRAGFKEWREKNSKASVKNLLVSLQKHKRKALAEEIASRLGLAVQQGSEMPEDDDFDKLITICEISMNPESAREFFRSGLQLDNDVTDALFQEDRNTFVRKGLLEWQKQRGAEATPQKLVHLLREGDMEAVADEICTQFDLGEPDLRAGQPETHMPVLTRGSMEQARTWDAGSTLSQGLEVEIPTSDAQQEASSILGSDESTKPMVVYGTTVVGDAARDTQRQRRTLETDCERVKHQDGSVECFHIDVENEASDNDGKASPARELCGSSTSLKDIEDVECSKPSDIISITEQKFEPANCEVTESSRSSEESDVKLLKLTNDVSSGHETDIFSGIGSPFNTGEIYSNESKSEYRLGAMAHAFLKQTVGGFFKSLKKNERISVPGETI